MSKESLVNEAYKLYVRDWYMFRGHSPDEAPKKIKGESPINIKSFEQYDFTDNDYMKALLPKNLYEEYQKIYA